MGIAHAMNSLMESLIWSFYTDHFADAPEFTELGEPAYNEYLDAVLHKTCQHLFGRAVV